MFVWVRCFGVVIYSPPPSKFDSARQNYPRDNFDGRGRLYKFSVALNIRLISNARLKLYNIYVFETTDNPRRVVTLNHLISRVLKTKITNIWFYYAENHVIILHSLKRITRLCSTIISSSTVQSFQSALRRVVTGLQCSSLMWAIWAATSSVARCPTSTTSRPIMSRFNTRSTEPQNWLQILMLRKDAPGLSNSLPIVGSGMSLMLRFGVSVALSDHRI